MNIWGNYKAADKPIVSYFEPNRYFSWPLVLLRPVSNSVYKDGPQSFDFSQASQRNKVGRQNKSQTTLLCLDVQYINICKSGVVWFPAKYLILEAQYTISYSLLEKCFFAEKCYYIK
jgi:hypothetical protein